MQQNLLSVKDFAAAAGVSQQSIYKRIQNKNDTLYPFMQKVGNKRYISINALSVIFNIEYQKEETTEQPQEQQTAADSSGKDEIIILLKEQIEAQQREIDNKNQLITDLMQQVEKAQQLINQEQQLHLIDKKQIFELEQKIEAAEQQQPKEKKKGIFSIFKRKAKTEE